MSLPEIDYGPLVDPIDPEETREYRRWAASNGVVFQFEPRDRVSSFVQLLWSAVVFGIALLFSALLISLLFTSERELSVGVVLLVIGLTVVLGGGLVFYAVWGVVRRVDLTSPWPRRARMARFAATNGFWFAPVSPAPPVPSSVIMNDRTSRTTDRFILSSDPQIEVGNFSRVDGDWVSKQRRNWGYIAIDIGAPRPHFALRSLRVLGTAPGMSLPGNFTRDQSMRLDGEVSRHFALFAPQGYSHEAGRVLTPELLSQLLAEGNLLDVEVVDHWLLLYSPRPFDLAAPETFMRVLRIAARAADARVTEQPQFGAMREFDSAHPPPRLTVRRRVAWLSVTLMFLWTGAVLARLIWMAS